MEELKQQSDLEKLFNSIEEYKGVSCDAKLVRDIVPIETWLNEEFYSGPSARQLYPYWKRAIIKVFSNPKRINEVIITGSIGTGKGLLINQTIPTPQGDKTIKDLKVGDYIFGLNGRPVKVIGIFPQGVRPVYKVYFKDKSYLDTDDQHLWTIHKGNIKKTMSTLELYQLLNDESKKSIIRDFEIPIAKPIEYSKKDFKIHPYNLGALLADGSFTEKEVRDYLYGSVEQRKELLYGLMDGDGGKVHRNREVSLFMYSTISKELAEDIVRLVTSLGGLANIHISKGRPNEPDLYMVHIDTPFNPFKASSHKKEWDISNNKRKQRGLTRKIDKIEYLDNKETICIKVDSNDELFIADTKYHIVTHNTTAAIYMIAYKLYELSCYFPPQALYNLMTDSKILFAYFNITKDIAGQVGFGQIRDLIDTIPYFKNIFRRDEKINSILKWPESRIYMKSASSSNDVLGMNLISFFVDEANFFKGDGAEHKGTSVNDVQSKAKVLYNSVRTRGKSRFVVNNEDFTFNVLVSSSMYESSFTENRIKESAGDDSVMVFDAKIWEVKNVDTYSKERFVVFSGNELIDPVICNSVADVNYIRSHYKLKELSVDTPNEAIRDIEDYDIKKRFIEVPMNFKKEFEGNIIQALQDIAGVPVASTGKLFSNRDSYARALLDEESPFTQDQIVISTNANVTIQDYFKKDWKPKDIDKKRFLHFDQSINGDSYGVAQCYIDGIIYDEYKLPKVVIKVDWMIRINPPKPPHKIDLQKVRSIIPWQEKAFGISYGTISYDTFQSAEAIQDLEKSGYPVKYRSVDRSDKEYLDLTELYYQGRIYHYRNEWYEKELFDLNWYRAQGKVDHPPVKEGGTKDVADAMCGSVANALEYPSIEEIQRAGDIDYFLGDATSESNYFTDKEELLNGFGNIY